jgi:hypothetical protein
MCEERGTEMDTDQIIAMIKRRRDDFFGSTAGSSSEDPLEYSAADMNCAIANEYGSLLLEIQVEQRSSFLEPAKSE